MPENLTITLPLVRVSELPSNPVNGTVYDVTPTDSTVDAGIYYKSPVSPTPIYLGPRPIPQ